MSNFSPYSNYGYMSIIPEATAGVPLTPTGFLKILSESIETNFANVSVQEIAGSRERNIRTVPGKIEVGGDVVFYVESKMIGHFLRGLFGAPTTQTLVANTAYRHVFEVSDTPKTYTIDLKPADAPWVHRYYGVQITAMKIEQDDNRVKCTATLAPRKAFINARVTASVGSGTTLTLDQTAGLTTSDSIRVLDKADGYTTIADYTIASVDSDTQLTVSTIGATLDVGDIVVIKKATTVTYNQDKVFTWLGGSQVAIGDDIDNTAVVSKENFELEYMNEVDPRWFAGLEESARYPGDVITKGFSSKGKIDKFYDNELNLDKLRKNAKIGFRMLMQGETAISANSAVAAYSEWGSSNGFRVTAATAGKAGNDISVTVVINTTDDLAATQSGNNITIALANTTASKNTGTLIAAAVDALSLVVGAAVGTGATQFTAAVASQNLGFYSGQTNVVGRDASEKPYLQFDHAAAKFDTFSPSASEDDVLMEEIPMTFYKDVETATIPKQWSVRIFLVNAVSSY